MTRSAINGRTAGARTGLLAAVLAVCAMPVSLASAQNALGDGRALDNSLSTRGRFNTSRPSLRDELAFRNSVVTGNAPNGLSFRGDVGYRAPGEFTGQLGSNDLFSFRRDSLQSGIAGMGIRGTEALQYQLALTTGARPPANLVGRFSVSRAGTTADAGQIVSGVNPRQSSGFAQRPAIDPDADDRGTMLWMLRSPSAYMSNSSLQTSSLRQIETNSGIYSLTASPLRGVRLSPIPELTAQRDAAREAAEAAEAEPQFGRPGPEEDEPATPQSGEAERPIRTLHSDLVGRINRDAEERAAEDVFADGQSLAERMRAMMERLAGVNESAEEERDAPDRGAREGGDDETGEEEDGTRLRSVRFDAETMRMLRGDGTPLSRFVDPEAVGRNVYAEHLQAGQELMADGRYFDAEERFASALGIKRGDVTAQIGRLHAQIGAGLYLSASLNLQSLALNRPEVFAAKYAPTLLPTEQRLVSVIDVLEQTIDGTTSRSRSASPQVRQAAGVLLGYLGYQLDRPELVERGMADFRERVTRGLGPDDPMPTEARLADLLTQMWTTDESDG